MDHLIERATRDDVPAIVALLADDPLGAGRESDDLAAYLAAYDVIDADPAHQLAVVRDADGTVVGTMQLTVLPGLSRNASTRLQVEGVRIAARARGTGLGSAMIAWAHQWGAARGARVAQLTTDRSRTDARRFYERLGYVASHVGMKKEL